MKTSRFTESQIVATLKQADAGVPVKDICRQAGISVATYYQWKSKYGGLEASDLRRVKELEAENAKLKRRTFCEDVRDQHLFSNLEEVRESTHRWMIDDNASRPRDALNGATPHEYRYQSAKRSTFDLSA